MTHIATLAPLVHSTANTLPIPIIIGGADYLTSAARTLQAITRDLNTEPQLCGWFLNALDRGDGQIHCP